MCISIKYTTRATQVALWFSSERKNLSPFTKDFRGLDHEKVFDSFCRRSDTTYQTMNEQLTPIYTSGTDTPVPTITYSDTRWTLYERWPLRRHLLLREQFRSI